MTQPQQTQLARKWKLEINTGSVATPTWTQVKGINEFTPQVGEANLEEDNDYDSDGWGSSTKTMLNWSAEAKLLRKADPGTNALDTGQEKLRTQSRLFGSDGVAHVRFYDRNGGVEAYEGFAEVSWGAEGGSPSDLETVTVTLTGKGALEEIANPG